MPDWSWGQAGQGAMGGATAGMAVGGPIGALIGGIGGGLFGGIGGDPQSEYQAMLKRLQAGYQNRVAPQMGQAYQAGQSQLMGNRAQLIAQLEAQARGDGPSAARQQMQQAADRTAQMMASNAAGAGGRGVNAGAAMRNAGNQAANVMQQNNQNMGIMRAQEQLNAVGQLGQNINAGIGQDNAMSQFNAGQMNDRNSLNAQLQMQMLGLNDRSQLQAIQMGMGGAGQGLGTSLMAGGAMAAPMLMQWHQAQQGMHGYGGAVGEQIGQPGSYTADQWRAYIAQQNQGLAGQPGLGGGGIDPNTWGGNHPWSPGR
jgi:hypothetical protein